MSLRSMLDRSRDALYALTVFNPVGVERVEDVGTGMGIGSSGEQLYGPVVGGMNGLLGGSDLRNVLFWAAIAVVLLLLAALSNPNENSFRSHLTELSFRRHLVDIRATDSLNSSSPDHPDTESTTHAHPVTVIPASHSTSTSAPTPFRFANHVAINLRTPPMLYRSHWFFSTGVTTPLTSPSILALSDPMSVLRRVRDKERDRSTVFIGFFGHWSPVTINLVSDLIVAVLGDGREKGKRRERPGILDVKALSAKDDAPASKALPLAPKLLKSEPATEPLVPPTPPPSSSRRPSLGQPAPDAADSPLVVSLKADLTSAQLTLSDLKHQLQLHESSTDSTLTSTLEELRNRRKEDDAERQELKSKTKSLEEQKRQAESARRDAEKKLRAVEALRDGLESKIAAARTGAVETRENMDQSERNVRSIQEEGARHVVETLDNVESKRKELSRMEAELVDLESRNEHLVELVKEAEDRLKVVTESGARASPEEEMMMMAAAYEAAAQEGYLSQTQNQWAHQAAAYMAEAGMPYLGQDYTARPTTRTTNATTPANSNQQHHDLSGFEDFGPGPGVRERADRDYLPLSKSQSPFHPPLAPLGHSATAPPPSAPFSHSTTQQVRSRDIHTPEAVEDEGVDEIGPGSPNGISFLPQGLFRSLEGDATPIDLEGQESGGSDSGDELWRSPRPEHSLPVSASESRRLLPPSSTTPPAVAGSGPVPPTGVGAGAGAGPGPVLPGLPALPGPRRWFSGSGSTANSHSHSGSASVENLAFSFMQPPGTISNDSLVNFDPSRPSPFAPSASEKNALLKWPLSRWARGNYTATATATTTPTQQSTPDPSAQSSSVDLGHGTLPTSIPGPNGNGNGKSTSSSGNWFSSSRFGTSPSNRSVSATERRVQDAFSAFNSSSTPTITGGGSGGGGMFGKRNLDNGNAANEGKGRGTGFGAGAGDNVEIVDDGVKAREGAGNISLNSNTSTTDDEDQDQTGEKKFSRFFSLKKTSSSTS